MKLRKLESLHLENKKLDCHKMELFLTEHLRMGSRAIVSWTIAPG